MDGPLGKIAPFFQPNRFYLKRIANVNFCYFEISYQIVAAIFVVIMDYH